VHRADPGVGANRHLNSKPRSSRDLRTYSPLSVETGKKAIFQAAAMVGGVALARAVQDHRLSDEILKSFLNPDCNHSCIATLNLAGEAELTAPAVETR
jgi:hypothetical protein